MSGGELNYKEFTKKVNYFGDLEGGLQRTSGPDVFSGESVMQTTSPLTWSHRPEPDLIGVSVFQHQNHFSLRFHLRTTHLDKIQNPKTLSIRGSAQNGFILTPDSKTGVKPSLKRYSSRSIGRRG